MELVLPLRLDAATANSFVQTCEKWCTPVPNLHSGADSVQKQLASALEYSPLVAVMDLAVVHLGAFCAIRQVASRPDAARLYLHLLPLLSVVAIFCYAMGGLYRSWSRRRRRRSGASLR